MPANSGIGSVRLNSRQSQVHSLQTQKNLKYIAGGTALTLGAAIVSACYFSGRSFNAPANARQFHSSVAENQPHGGQNKAVDFHGGRNAVRPAPKKRDTTPAMVSQRSLPKMPSDQRNSAHFRDFRDHQPKDKKSTEGKGNLSGRTPRKQDFRAQQAPFELKTADNKNGTNNAKNQTRGNGKNESGMERKKQTAVGSLKGVNLQNVDPSYVAQVMQPDALRKPEGAGFQKWSGNVTQRATPFQNHPTRIKRGTGIFHAGPDSFIAAVIAAEEIAIPGLDLSSQESAGKEINIRLPKASLSWAELDQQIRASSEFTNNTNAPMGLTFNVSEATLEQKKAQRVEHLEKLVGAHDNKLNRQMSQQVLRKLERLAQNSQLDVTDLFRYAAGNYYAQVAGRRPDSLSARELDNLLAPFVESVFFVPGFTADIRSQSLNKNFSQIQQLVADKCKSYSHALSGQFNLIHSYSDALHEALTKGMLSGLSSLFLRDDVDEIGFLKYGSLNHLVTELGHLQDQEEGIDVTITSNELYHHGLDVVTDYLSETVASEDERNLVLTQGDRLRSEVFANAERSINLSIGNGTTRPEIKENLALIELLRDGQEEAVLSDVMQAIDDKIQLQHKLDEILETRKKLLNESENRVDQLYANNSITIEGVAAERARKIGYEPDEQVEFKEWKLLPGPLIGGGKPYWTLVPTNGTVVQAQMMGSSRVHSGVKLVARKGNKNGQEVWLTQDALREDVLKQIPEKLDQLKVQLPNQQKELFLNLIPGNPVALHDLNMHWSKLQGTIVEYEKDGTTFFMGLKRYPDRTWTAPEDIPVTNFEELQDYIRENWESFVNYGKQSIRLNNGTETTLPSPTDEELTLRTYRGSPEEIVNKTLEPLKHNLRQIENYVKNTIIPATKELKSGRKILWDQWKRALPQFAQLMWDIGEGKRMEPKEVFLRGIVGGIEIAALATGGASGMMKRKMAWKQRNLAPSTGQNNLQNPAGTSVGRMQIRGSQSSVLNRGNGLGSARMVSLNGQQIPVQNSVIVRIGNRQFEAVQHNNKLYKLHPQQNGKQKAIELTDQTEISATQLCLSGRTKRGTGMSCLRSAGQSTDTAAINTRTAPSEEFIEKLLKQRHVIPGSSSGMIKSVADLKKQNFPIPPTVYRAHSGTEGTRIGLQRAPGAKSGDDYIAAIIQHTSRTSGSGGKVISLTAREAIADGFATTYRRDGKTASVYTIDTTKDSAAFRTGVDIILNDGERMVREGRVTRATLLKAIEQLKYNEFEVFYVKGDIPQGYLIKNES